MCVFHAARTDKYTGLLHPSPLPPCRLLFWAVGCGLRATASLLLSVLQAQSGSSAAAAAGVLRRALQGEVGGEAAAGALAGMDGLSQLHLSMQATTAAAMQRAAEVRRRARAVAIAKGGLICEPCGLLAAC